jgi:hypothetical protein
MSTPHYFQGNRLLDALSSAEKIRIYPQLERILLPLGFAMYDSRLSQRYVYFPAGAVISLQCLMTNGNAGETAAVGNEGMVGTAIVMGAESTLGRAVVKRAGIGYRLKSQAIKQEFDRAGRLMRLLLRYTQALITQTSQNAVCTRHHSIDQQVCRKLLESLDRTQTTEMRLTQEILATVLGVRRESVTTSAGKLRKVGLICYGRGHISVLDRAGLERRSCECYEVVKREYTRLLCCDLAARGEVSRSPTFLESSMRNAHLPNTDYGSPAGLQGKYRFGHRAPPDGSVSIIYNR